MNDCIWPKNRRRRHFPILESFFKAKENMFAGLCSVEVEFCPSADYFNSMNDEFFKDCFKRKRLRNSVNKGDCIYMKSVFELSMLVKII